MMGRLTGRLGSLRARDIMTKRVIVVSETDSLSQAIVTLKEQRITGAPVVDDRGRLTGMVSISDLLTAGTSAKQTGEHDSEADRAKSDDSVTWELLDWGLPLQIEPSDELVSTRMTRQVSSVTETARLVDVARLMCRGHWHRVPVIDDQHQLCGIISTMDILAAIVHADEE